MVRLKQLIEEIGSDKSVILKAAKKMGIYPTMMIFETHGQQECAFTEEEAGRIRERYKHRIK